MTEQIKNRTIEWLLAGMAFLLTASWLLQATPLRYTLLGLPALLAVYVLLHGVEHALRATAAWCMSWAEGIAHRKKVGGKWESRLGRRGQPVNAQAATVPASEDEQYEVAQAV